MIMMLSLIIPCYNEEACVEAMQNAVIEAFADAPYTYETVFVDDGSRDGTGAALRRLYKAQKCPTKVIGFTRNFGKEAAIFAGLQHCGGDLICVIDGDLQQPPALAREMAAMLTESDEYDMVAAYQENRGESALLRFFKKGFYGLIKSLSDVPLYPGASDFRVFRRCVAESILAMGEYHRFSKGIFAWVGYPTKYIPYVAAKREAGKSKWSFRKLFGYAVEGIIGFSVKPLRIATVTGFCSALASFIYLIVVILQKLIAGIDVPGYATAIVLILFLGGMELLCMGLIGEYVGRTFEQSKHRPIYLAREVLDYSKRL